MKYTTIHGIIKMPERQPFCLVLDRSTLTKVENSASTYDAQFLLPENDIDWIPLIEEKITKQGKIFAETFCVHSFKLIQKNFEKNAVGNSQILKVERFFLN